MAGDFEIQVVRESANFYKTYIKTKPFHVRNGDQCEHNKNCPAVKIIDFEEAFFSS